MFKIIEVTSTLNLKGQPVYQLSILLSVQELYSNEMAEKIRLPPLETGAAAHAQGSLSSVSMPLPGAPADGQGFVPGKVSPARPSPEGNGGR